MRDFCNSNDRDCIRLIVAQDLKESGIDVDASNLANFSTIQNTTHNNINNNSYNLTSGGKHSNSSHHHHHHHHNNHHHHNHSSSSSNNKSHSNQLLNTSGVHNTTNNNFFHNTSNHNFNIFQSGSSSSSSKNNNNNTNVETTLNSQHDSQLSGSKLFGVSLKQIEMVNLVINEQTLTVPCFLKYAIDYLNEFIHVEGIFRRNGTASRLKELKKQVEEGIYNFSQFAIFDLTSLIKLFFRELPESLLTFSLYSNFIQAVKLETTKSKLESILNLCLQLPDINLQVLIYLMHFLKQITLQESLNKMNSFNLAVCFAPNIIYTRINKVNDLYINEERVVIQLLIENSGLIGKISDSVYERSMMLNSLCCSTTIMMNSNTSNNNSTNPNTTNLNDCESKSSIDMMNGQTSTTQSSVITSSSSSSSGLNNNNLAVTSNNDLIFLYDNDLQENSSFAIHHAQSAGSTSLSSYCGSSSTNSKKEKKKRRSSSLKELMITIQNSISKFRRRSASEKNDKTTCSIITCTSMTTAGSSSNCGTSLGDTTSCSSRFLNDNEKQKLIDSTSIGSNFLTNTPYIGHINSSNILGNCKTPLCASLYATPRINKRNAEDSLQSTTKKKLMEKLPQRNLLLPNAPITPFSTSKKSKHPFKQLLSTSEASSSSSTSASQSVNIGGLLLGTNSSSLSSNVNNQMKSSNITDQLNLSNKPPLASSSNQMLNTPQQIQKQLQTPSTLKNTNIVIGATPAIGLHKQLRYEDSPSILNNQTCDLGSFKPKYPHHSIDKNLSLATADLLVSSSLNCKSSGSSSLSSCSSKHHHHHHHSHHHHHHSSGGSSSHRHHDREHRHNHHHHYHSSSQHSSSHGHHHHHHHHHKHSSSIKSSSSSRHHQYVNAIPSSTKNAQNHSSSSSGNSSCTSSSRYTINPNDLCTKIISGSSYNNLIKSSGSSSNSSKNNVALSVNEINFNSDCLSTTSASNSSGSNNVSIEKSHNHVQNFHNHTSACCGITGHQTQSSYKYNNLQERSLIGADSSMRCTLRRGRPNTPKSGLSVDYRIRKSSVPNTPECKHFASNKKINYTISNDDIQIKSSDFKKADSKTTKSKSKHEKNSNVIVSSTSLNTAIMGEIEASNPVVSSISENNLNSKEVDDLNDARWLDHDIDIDENLDLDENINDRQIIDDDDMDADGDDDEDCNSNSSLLSASRSAPSQSPSRLMQINQNNSLGNRQLSLSLSNLPQATTDIDLMTQEGEEIKSQHEKNTTTVSDSSADILKSLNENEKSKLNNTNEFFEDEPDNKENETPASSSHSSAKNEVKNNNDNSKICSENFENVPQTILEQQSQIAFEPFEFKLPDIVKTNSSKTVTRVDHNKSDFEYILDQEQKNNSSNDDTLLQNVLRRQSLFKLKEKINGKVSKQISEIEQRKLSPYRFSNSPLKHKKSKESSISSLTSAKSSSSSKHVSPIRVPSIFCKKILSETPQESYIVKTSKSSSTRDKLSKTIASACTTKFSSHEPKLPNDSNSSPLLVRAASQFYKKLNRNRSIKRLNVTMSSNVSQAPLLASISENECVSSVLKPLDLNKIDNTKANSSINTKSSNVNNSPIGKQLLNANEWQCSNESIDL